MDHGGGCFISFIAGLFMIVMLAAIVGGILELF